MSSRFSNGGKNTPRRSACDRCREHKLRCLRDNSNQEPCRRCSRAGADCITGQALPPGRPIQGARLEKRGNNTTSSKRQVTTPTNDRILPASSLPLEIDSNQPNGNDSLPQSMPQDISFMTPSNHKDGGEMDYVPSWLGISTDRTHQSQNSASITINQAEGNVSGLAMPMTDVVNSPSGHGDPLLWMDPGSLDQFGLMFPGSNGLHTPQQDSPGISAMETFRGIGLQPVELPVGFHDTQQGTQASTPALTETLGTPPTTDTCEVVRLPDQRIASDYMQQLSYVNLNLDKLLRRIDTASSPTTLNNLVFPHPDDYPKKTITVGDTLSLSTKFLDILNFLQPPRPLASFALDGSFIPTNSESDSRSALEQMGTSTGSPSNVASNISASCDKSTASARSHNSTHSSGASSATPARQPAPPVTSVYLGTPGILLILSCYQQFIRMYSIIFSIAYDTFAVHTLPGFPPSLRALPGIRYSDFPVDSGNMQAMLLIQITLHLVGHMEKVLGLPREFRVQEVGGEYDGILSSEAGLQLLRMVVGDVNVGGGIGNGDDGSPERGGWQELKLLRRSIRRITHTVQNSMAW